MRHRSKKQAAIYRNERIPIVKRILTNRPICQRCQAARSTDVHEIKSRARGGSITDITNLVALCRPCHTWITGNPAQATADGWLKHSWDD